MNSKRIIYLDMLKVISCIAVVVLHVTASAFKTMAIQSESWLVVTSVNMLTRFAVPIFVMVSGALFLNPDKNIDIKKLYKKNILHLVIVYVFWTVIYSIYNVYNNDMSMNMTNIIKDAVLESYYHLWFIPMLIGIYICIPIVRTIVKNNKEIIEYFLIIFLVFKIIPQTILLFKFPYSGYIAAILERIEIPLLSYIGYFILGYYLHAYDLSGKVKKLIYIIGVIAAIIAIIVTIGYSFYVGKAVETLCREFSITTFAMSVAIFVLVKNMLANNKIKFEKQIIHLSDISLGIYLIHELFRAILKNQVGLSSAKIWNLPIVILVTLIASYIVSYIIKRIPFVNKYLI